MTVICPLCVQTCFSSLDALHHRLIKASNGPLACPICNEILMGLDKLTIHLFCHSTNRSTEILPDKKGMTNIENAVNFNCDTSTLTMPQMPFPTISNTDTTNLTTSNDITSINNFESSEWHGNIEVPVGNGVSKEKSDQSKESIQYAEPAEGIGDSNIVLNQLMETDFQIQNLTNEECSESQNIYLQSGTNNYNGSFMQDNQNMTNMDSFTMCKTSDGDSSPKLWRCNTCSKSFTTKYFLKKHKRLHTGEMPYTCEICARTFTFQQSYHKHLMYHSDEKPHTCSTCGRAFKELSTLHNHERIHSGEKPYKCEVCGKCFRQRVSFLVHSRIHTGVMPYKCEICNKSFRYKVTQRTHKCQLRPADMSVDETEPTVKSTDSTSDKFYTASPTAVSSELADFPILPETSSSKSTEMKINDVLQTPPINEMLLSSKDTYLPLLDIQNIRLFSPNENDSVQSSFSNIFD